MIYIDKYRLCFHIKRYIHIFEPAIKRSYYHYILLRDQRFWEFERRVGRVIGTTHICLFGLMDTTCSKHKPWITFYWDQLIYIFSHVLFQNLHDLSLQQGKKVCYYSFQGYCSSLSYQNLLFHFICDSKVLLSNSMDWPICLLPFVYILLGLYPSQNMLIYHGLLFSKWINDLYILCVWVGGRGGGGGTFQAGIVGRCLLLKNILLWSPPPPPPPPTHTPYMNEKSFWKFWVICAWMNLRWNWIANYTLINLMFLVPCNIQYNCRLDLNLHVYLATSSIVVDWTWTNIFT